LKFLKEKSEERFPVSPKMSPEVQPAPVSPVLLTESLSQFEEKTPGASPRNPFLMDQENSPVNMSLQSTRTQSEARLDEVFKEMGEIEQELNNKYPPFEKIESTETLEESDSEDE